MCDKFVSGIMNSQGHAAGIKDIKMILGDVDDTFAENLSGILGYEPLSKWLNLTSNTGRDNVIQNTCNDREET